MIAKLTPHSSREAGAQRAWSANERLMFKRRGERRRAAGAARRAFTLVEILVVIGIILLLMAILVPSLSRARSHSKAAACLTNLRQIGVAVAQYRNENRAHYPPSYVYPDSPDGTWTTREQLNEPEFGVLHWSYIIYNSETPDPLAFQCPDYPNGGAPRTHPGPERRDWEASQIAGNGTTGPEPGALTDRQAPRMSYAANAAVIPPNRFTVALSEGDRVNVLVQDHVIRSPGKVILATEFLNEWKALSEPHGDGFISRSHRPIDVFAHTDSGYDEYVAPTTAGAYVHGTYPDDETFGLLPAMELRGKTDLLAVDPQVSGVNAVGRSHFTSDREYNDKYGGGANFLYADAHARLIPTLETLRRRQWGRRYYSISGSNRVVAPDQAEKEVDTN